ncbi:MAG: ABC transporter permease [Clostridiales Family XIII bacterium]|jgi:peptide/nickel transport system permease protein|nr:ABC transporter permease [Clostridiales Family XIII bacterium]
MVAYIVRRMLHACVVVLLVSILIFIIIRLLPGDPIIMLLNQSTGVSFTAEQIEDLRHQFGLDKPIPVQYKDWILDVLRGDFGISIINRYNIGAEIAKKLPVTLCLGLTSFVIGLIIGPILGVISAVRRGKAVDTLVTIAANIGITAPQFWVGILLIFLFGLKLGWLPIYGYTLPWEDFVMSVKQSVMPVVVLAMFPVASSARQMRSSMIEVMHEDYIRTAWAKGLKEKAVIIRHAVKNSLIPVVTLQGLLLRNIVGGSVIVETVFVIPGMGKFMIDSMLAHDYTVVQACAFIMILVVVISNLIVDLSYGWLDPRIRYD